MKILITGAAGFMGSHLADYLISTTKYKIFGVDDLSGGYLRNVPKNCRFTKLDLRKRKATKIYLENIKPDIIFHLAADATEGRSQFTPINCTERNYIAYLNLLIPAINNKVKKIVLTSSMSVYGDQTPPFPEDMEPKPKDIYGISKTAMEKATAVMSRVYGFKYTIVRPHNVYGPRQNMADPYRNVVAIFINCLLRNKNFYIYGDGKQKRAFTYIDDFTPYFAKTAFLKKTDGEIINIGPEKEHAINKLAEVVIKSFGYRKNNIPNHLKPKYLPERPQEVKDAFCTSDKAKRLLGFRNIYSLEEGVKKTVEWAKSLGPQIPKYVDSLELESDLTPKSWKDKLI